MPKIQIVNVNNEEQGYLDLSDDVFGANVNLPVVHQVLKAERSSIRVGGAYTKTKGEVRGGGKKPFKQKGTGNARQGSTRSPLHPGGGTTFGPRGQNFIEKINKKVRRLAYRSVLSERLSVGRIKIVDSLVLPQAKTKVVQTVFHKQLGVKKAFVLDEENVNLFIAARNHRDIKAVRYNEITVYDVLKHEWIVLTVAAAKAIDTWLGQSDSAQGENT